MTWSLAQSNISRNDRGEHLLTEELFQIGHDLVRQIGSLIEHGQEHAFELQPWITRSPNLLNRRNQCGNAFERKVLTLDGNQDTIGGNQRVNGQYVERGWTVDEDIVEFRPHWFDDFGKPLMSITLLRQLHRRANEFFACRRNFQGLEFGRLQDVIECFPLHQDVVGRFGVGPFSQA